MREIDARGLSCPEPVMQVNMALGAFPGEELKILLGEAHTFQNVQDLLNEKKISFEGKELEDHYEIIARP